MFELTVKELEDPSARRWCGILHRRLHDILEQSTTPFLAMKTSTNALVDVLMERLPAKRDPENQVQAMALPERQA